MSDKVHTVFRLSENNNGMTEVVSALEISKALKDGENRKDVCSGGFQCSNGKEMIFVNSTKVKAYFRHKPLKIMKVNSKTSSLFECPCLKQQNHLHAKKLIADNINMITFKLWKTCGKHSISWNAPKGSTCSIDSKISRDSRMIIANVSVISDSIIIKKIDVTPSKMNNEPDIEVDATHCIEQLTSGNFELKCTQRRQLFCNECYEKDKIRILDGGLLKDVSCHHRTFELCKLSLENIDWARLNKFDLAEICSLYLDTYNEDDKLLRLILKKEGLALEHVPLAERSIDLCKIALSNRGFSLKFVPDDKKTKDICLMAVKKNGYAIQFVPTNLINDEICELALAMGTWMPDATVLEHIPEINKTENVCKLSVEQDGSSLEFVPDDKKTENICLTAVKQNGYALRFVPTDMRSHKICRLAVINRFESVAYVPEHILIKLYNKGNPIREKVEERNYTQEFKYHAVYYNIPFGNKDKMKDIGGKWDNHNRLWYVYHEKYNDYKNILSLLGTRISWKGEAEWQSADE